jgi:uncharacterized protein (TIRG00374 family)
MHRSAAVRWAAQAGLGLGLLALVLWRVDPRDIADQFERFRVGPAIAVVLLNIPVLLVYTLRSQFVLQRLGHRVSFGAMLPIATLGSITGSLTPAAAGDLLRTPFYRTRHDIPYSEGFPAVIYERGYSFAIMAATTGLAAAWYGLPAAAAAAISAATLLGTLALPRAGAFALARLEPWLVNRQGSASVFARTVERLTAGLKPLLLLLRDDQSTAFTMATSLVAFSLMGLQMWLIGRSLDIGLSPLESWLAMGSALLAAVITLLPLGIGSMDATITALVGATEAGFDAGAAAAVLVRLTMTLPFGLLAVASYFYLVTTGRRSEARRQKAGGR